MTSRSVSDDAVSLDGGSFLSGSFVHFLAAGHVGGLLFTLDGADEFLSSG